MIPTENLQNSQNKKNFYFKIWEYNPWLKLYIKHV